MKTKITIKTVRDDPRSKIAVGYCELQDVLYWLIPEGYNAGIYGWNFDAYGTDTAVITTGYRHMVGKYASAEAIDHANAAFAAWRNAHPSATCAELRSAARDVLDSFCREVLTAAD
jgi:hypothetical protein|nr:MAG TPA: hypothetical protein [Caudoviricetes sp.]